MYEIDGKEFSDSDGIQKIYDLLSVNEDVSYFYSGGISFVFHAKTKPWHAKELYLQDDGIYVDGSANKIADLPIHKRWGQSEYYQAQDKLFTEFLSRPLPFLRCPDSTDVVKPFTITFRNKDSS